MCAIYKLGVGARMTATPEVVPSSLERAEAMATGGLDP